MKVVIVDAYARSNAGDGLLVDETRELVEDAFPGADVQLVAMAPESFPEFPGALHPVAGHRSDMTLIDLFFRGVSARPHRAVRRAIADADIAVAVGGGYLRADSISAALKTTLSHLVQAPTARSRTPYVYLPQSIGPLPPRFIPLGFGRLRHAVAVFVRDDRSLGELTARGIPARRLPDLAAIAAGTRAIEARRSDSHRAALIARRLPRAGSSYDVALDRIISSLGAELLVQSSGRGNDDPQYYRERGWGDGHRPLTAALDSTDPPAVTVSVRLHGSLQSILAGVPSVHLSYERKGWGAYEDLGIAEYVHSARDFDADLVIEQARQLDADPSGYWTAIERAKPALRDARSTIVSTLQSTVHDRDPGRAVHGAAGRCR